LLVGLWALGSPGTAALGAETAGLYARHCAVCHGPGGAGDGPAAGLLVPPPRDFRTGRYKLRSTPTGTLPTEDDVAATIRRGLPGTSMPAYADLLPAADIVALARRVLAWAPPGVPRGEPIALGAPPPAGSAAVARGRALYGRAGCPDCHGPSGRPRAWRPAREGPGEPGPPPDLGEPWTFRGGATPEAIVRRLLTGLDGSAMPAYAGSLTPAEAWDVARFVETLGRTPVWRETDVRAIAAAGVDEDLRDRGRYLVNAMLCPLCHTPISATSGAYDTGRFLAGGMRVAAYPWGVWYSRNLTPDPETGLGRWTEVEIVAALRRGIAPDGRRLDPMAMPWPWFSRLTDGDARAIATYLRAVPSVRNPVPSPRAVPLAERVGGKLLALLGRPVAVEFWGGNAAGADPTLRGIPAPPALRRWSQIIGWALPILAGLALAGGLRPPRRPAGIGCGLLIVGVWIALAIWPPFRLMSPEVTTRWLFQGAPALPVGLDGPARALAARGEYLVTIAPCGLCHTPAGAFAGFYTGRALAGGMEARWQVYGRAVSTNLTPHRRDGIIEVPDSTLLRAMRAGIGRDGRRLHWQAMPWDIGSRWSEEDQRAMVAYLRVLPPVAGAVPSPRAPRPADPPADTFFFGDAATRVR
jgi:mono/diheme cytochrome c family protein